MKIFESEAGINKPAKEVYQFLADMNNHRQLMPENILDWTSSADEARFNIQNMAKLSLRITSRIENTEVKIIPFEKPPFDLELKWALLDKGAYTEVVFTIAADLSMMMKMLASGPLQKLAEHEMRRLTELLG